LPYFCLDYGVHFNQPERNNLILSQVIVRPVQPTEENRFQELMDDHHYLGSLPKIGNTIRYVTTYKDEWIGLISFSAAALKCASRDRWIGWAYRHQYDRLHLIANNSRFLILPHCHYKNLATKILSLCRKRIQRDWENRFGFPLLLLETFVDPSRFAGTTYKAANWKLVGETKGYQRIRGGYSNTRKTPKLVFVQPLQRNPRPLLSNPFIDDQYVTGESKMKLTAEQMRSLPDFFRQVDAPRRTQEQRHRLHIVLAIAAGAILCGMRGYKAIWDWADALTPKARIRFGCRWKNGQYVVPSESTIRNVLIRVEPASLDEAIQLWNGRYGAIDSSLAIDGKVMFNAIDE